MKKLLTTVTLAVVMTFTATFANAGITVSDFAPQNDPCTANSTSSKEGIIINSSTGIIINSLTGIIINSLTGIIINSATDTPPVNCGIIINS